MLSYLDVNPRESLSSNEHIQSSVFGVLVYTPNRSIYGTYACGIFTTLILEKIAVTSLAAIFAPAKIPKFFNSNGATRRIGFISSAISSFMRIESLSFVSSSWKYVFTCASTCSKVSPSRKRYPGSIYPKKFSIESEGKKLRRFTGTIRTTGCFSCLFGISLWIAQRNTAVKKTVIDTWYSRAFASTSFTDSTASVTWSGPLAFRSVLIWYAFTFSFFSRRKSE